MQDDDDNGADQNFLKSNTKTLPSEALAPTFVPLEFQQTSNIPPVPL
ncbi:hypothetical protein DOY81_008227 [Sarcophaga bullata]|nr:hypothetical protein DOY81_008227 [Sarcophaga bullata]